MEDRDSIYKYYLHQLRNCEIYLQQCLIHAEPEIVHQFRLSIKKIQAFEQLAHHLQLSDYTHYRALIEKVKKMFKLAGQIRDTQVQIYMLASFTEQSGISYTLFNKWLLRREKSKISQLCVSNLALSIDSESVIDTYRIPSNDMFFVKDTIVCSTQNLLDEMFLKAQKLATGNISNENLHEIRKVAKQIRYISTLICSIYPDFVYQRITAWELKEIENAVGSWHDCLVRIEFINRFVRKIKSRNDVIILKYEGLAEYSRNALEESYENACRVVKIKFLG